MVSVRGTSINSSLTRVKSLIKVNEDEYLKIYSSKSRYIIKSNEVSPIRRVSKYRSW